MCRELRRNVGLNLVESGIGVGADNVEEGGGNTIQQLPGLVERHDCILERGPRGVVGDLVDFGELLLHALGEGREVVRVFDFVEGRRLQGQRTRLREGISRDRTLGHGCGSSTNGECGNGGCAQQQVADRMHARSPLPKRRRSAIFRSSSRQHETSRPAGPDHGTGQQCEQRQCQDKESVHRMWVLPLSELQRDIARNST